MAAVACPGCRKEAAIVPPAGAEAAARLACPACGEFEVVFFPALRRAVPPPVPAALPEGGASCFYHPRKAAVRTCDGCGAFLCDLCDLDLGGTHLCPRCLGNGTEGRPLESVENSRIRLDGIALGLALIPCTLAFWFLGIFTAPLAIGCALWKQPRRLVPTGPGMRIAAVILAVLEIVAVIYFILYAVELAHHKAKSLPGAGGAHRAKVSQIQ
jgi:hypothetical protein